MSTDVGRRQWVTHRLVVESTFETDIRSHAADNDSADIAVILTEIARDDYSIVATRCCRFRSQRRT